MMKLSLALVLVTAAAGGCSKSSAEAPVTNKPVPSDLPAPVTAAPAAPTADTKGPAGVDVDTVCDDACTNLAICHERFYPGEDFRDGQGCVESCKEMAAPERTRWAADVADAHRTNQCARLFDNEDAAPAAAATPGAGTATLAEGEPRLGCFAWSEQSRAAACVTGEHGTSGAKLRLAFVGGGPAAVQLVDADQGGKTEIDFALAGVATSLLAKGGFEPLAGKASPLAPGTSKQVNGVSITFTKKTTSSRGDNVAPTENNRVVASCGGKTIELFHEEAEGTRASVAVRAIGGHALVEISIRVSREGEFADGFHAVLVEAGTCEVAKSEG